MQKTAAIVIFLIFTSVTRAGYFYGGLNYSFNGVISVFDEYNGATKWAPGLVFGVKHNIVALELFFRNFTLTDEFETGGAEYNIEIDTVLYGGGLRLTIFPNIDVILGVNSQNINTSVNPSLSFQLLDKSYVSYYVGGGYNLGISDSFKGQLDMLYYKGEVNYGLIGLVFSVVYKLGAF